MEALKMNKKIDLFINGKYICSTIRYKTCKDFIQRVKEDGFIQWQGLKEFYGQIKPCDVLKARFSK